MAGVGVLLSVSRYGHDKHFTDERLPKRGVKR
jgi:hypothetical protein